MISISEGKTLDTEGNRNQEAFADMNWLANHPDKTLGSKYHDAGSCWTLIDECLNEIRRLRNTAIGG